MTRICKVTLITMLVSCLQSQAQRLPSPDRFEVEADPVAFIFNGYSFHLGYTRGHLRFDAGIFGIKQPSFAVENKLFSVFSSGGGIKVDYLLRRNRGLFIGLQSDYATDKVGLKSDGDTQSVSGVTLGLRTGYRFMFGKEERQFKGFYLVPWVGLIHALNPSIITSNGHDYTQSRWSVFPTIHLGYRF
ncbi:hypothetical protein GCM10007423_21820 [Dyadobacter endophyticus]|uniref:DUF3575 domain-containing protein n=1 Tax=Dyadobacter endophyticus TaxID=1749036 RepID=A0ABQ1YPV4_9BACT|nr:hypothetical protein [Dyadobacter endophyticus]GGH32367.1 hypothetical protein GCM10007423_21820 [Dyadobacter endophyticus]